MWILLFYTKYLRVTASLFAHENEHVSDRVPSGRKVFAIMCALFETTVVWRIIS